MPSRWPVKCATATCHQRARLNTYGVSLLRQEQERATANGGRAGLICPRCIKEAFDRPDRWTFEMELGEMMLEALVDEPRWRFVIDPA